MLDVHLSDLKRDPLGEVRRLYRELGIELNVDRASGTVRIKRAEADSPAKPHEGAALRAINGKPVGRIDNKAAWLALVERLKAPARPLVLALEVPDAVLTERICGRWVHKASGRSYHAKFSPPKSLGDQAPTVETMLDDETGEPLMKRSDDTEEALRKRLVAFHSQTKPVVDYYSKQGLYAPIDANQKADTVKAAIAKIVAGC